MSLNVNGTVINKVNFNGSAVSQIVVNGATVWPYLPGTQIFTYGWSPGGNIDTFITNIYATYPLAFTAAPYYTTGNGGTPGNQILNFTLAAGFQVTSYTQAQYGTYAPYQTAGYNFTYMWCGRTVTGLQQSGNGSSSMTVSFVGTVPYKQVFTSGSGNWTVPSGVTSIVVTMIGAGGNGNANEGHSNPGPGGGSGAYFNSVTVSVTPGQSIAYSVGAPGTVYEDNAIYSGGPTSFGSLIAGGGQGGHWRSGTNGDERGGNGGVATGAGGVNGTAGNDGSWYGGNGYGANSPFGIGGVGYYGSGYGGNIVNGGTASGFGAGGGGGGNNASGGFGSPGVIYINW